MENYNKLQDEHTGKGEEANAHAALPDITPGYQGAPPPYSAGPQVLTAGGSTNVIIAQPGCPPPPGTITMVALGPEPVQAVCPGCGQCITTSLDYEMGSNAYTWMMIFCILGGLFCVWIPAVATSMQDVLHICPNCRTLIGRFNR